MNKNLNKALMVLLVVVITLSSMPISSITQTVSGSPFTVVAQAASETTHLNKTKKTIYIGRKYTLKLIDKKGETIPSSKVKWSRSNKSVASVSKSGVVTGKNAGKIKITATYKGRKYTAVITVKSAISVSKSTVTFNAGETAKKTIKVTCKDNKGIKWKTVEGSGIVKISQAKKWSNDTKSFYITPTGTKFGKVKIKIYSVENSKSYTYLTVNVKKPYTLEIKNSLPCIISNYESQDDMKNIIGDTAFIIRDVTYKTPDTKTLTVTVDFEAGYSKNIESYYFIKYRVFDDEGYLVESDAFKSKLMMKGDKAKAEITITGLKPGSYTIEFRDYVGNNSNSVIPDENIITADEALAMYQKAAGKINSTGVAGYSKKSWQTILNMDGLGILNGVITPIIESYITPEEDVEVKVNEKGSDDAKNRMPISNCSKDMVKSTSVEKLSNGNYKVVIVMKEQTNPSYADDDGLAVMSKDFLDYADIEEATENIAVVKSLEGEIKYVDYTITAEMTKNGNLVSIKHYGVGYIKANINGSINATGKIAFNAKYTDFKY